MLALERHHVPPRFAIDGHGHAHPHLVLVASGGFEEECGRSLHSMNTGGARLSRAHAAHRLAFGGDGADCFIAEAAGDFWARIFTRALGPSENAFAAMSTDEARTLALIGSPEYLAAQPARLLAFGRVLASFKTPASQAPSWFDDAVDMLDRGALKSVAAIADQVRRHRTHFARSFAAHAGLLPSEYRALRRAAGAATAVRAGEGRLCDIAMDHGYSHQSHMANAFRALFGLAPSQLRSTNATFLQDGDAPFDPCLVWEDPI